MMFHKDNVIANRFDVDHSQQNNFNGSYSKVQKYDPSAKLKWNLLKLNKS